MNSPLFNISASTIQPSQKVLPHGHAAKADFLNKRSEFTNMCVVSAVLSSNVFSYLHSKLSAYSLSMKSPLHNVLPSTNKPICHKLPHGHAMAEFLNKYVVSMVLSANVSYTHSSFGYSSSINSFLPNVSPSTNQVIHQTLPHGQGTIVDFLKCGVSVVLLSLTYSFRVLFRTSVVCEGMSCEIFALSVHLQHIQYIWFINGSPWSMPLCKHSIQIFSKWLIQNVFLVLSR